MHLTNLVSFAHVFASVSPSIFSQRVVRIFASYSQEVVLNNPYCPHTEYAGDKHCFPVYCIMLRLLSETWEELWRAKWCVRISAKLTLHNFSVRLPLPEYSSAFPHAECVYYIHFCVHKSFKPFRDFKLYTFQWGAGEWEYVGFHLPSRKSAAISPVTHPRRLRRYM